MDTALYRVRTFLLNPLLFTTVSFTLQHTFTINVRHISFAIQHTIHYCAVAQLSKLKHSNREVTKERARKRKVRKIQEERGRESSEVGGDVTATGLLPCQQSSSLVSDNSDESEDKDVLVSEGEDRGG